MDQSALRGVILCGGMRTLRSSLLRRDLEAFSGEKSAVVLVFSSSTSMLSSCGAEGSSPGCVGSSMVVMRASSSVVGTGSCSAESSANSSGALWRAVGAGMANGM